MVCVTTNHHLRHLQPESVAVDARNFDAVSSPILQASSVFDQSPLYQSTIPPSNLSALPLFVVSSPLNFVCSDIVDGADFIHSVTTAYAEVVHWKRTLSSGKTANNLPKNFPDYFVPMERVWYSNQLH